MRSKSPLVAVFLTVVIDLLGFGIVLPLLPLYADEFGAPGWQIGLLFSSFSIMQFITAPLWGRRSDRVGRRPVILIGLVGSFLSYVLFGLAAVLPQPLVWLFASRILAGIFGGTISTAYAYIADVTDEAGRGRGMALIGMAFGIGFTLGPAIGGLGHALHPAAPGFIAALFSVGAFLFAYRNLIEPEGRTGRARRGWRDLSGLGRALRVSSVPALLGAIFLTVTCFALMESTLGLLAKRIYAFDIWQVGLLFTYLGFWTALAQGMLVRRMLPKVGEVRFARIGAVVLGAGLLLLGASRDVLYLGLVSPLAVLGFSMLVPSVNALISRRTDPTTQGEVMGASQSLQSLARIVGPLIGLSLFDVDWPLPFRAGAAGMLIAVVLTMTLKKAPADDDTSATPAAPAAPTPENA